jgi:hypothetical protein
VRLTEFWDRMAAFFGEAYADSIAKDQVLSTLGGRTVNKALADGEDAKAVWRAVSEAFNVPDALRLPAILCPFPAGPGCEQARGGLGY